MPRRFLGPPKPTALTQRLLRELTAELRSPKETGQPLILEQEKDRSRAVHVTVVWDEWQPCPPEQRSDLILEAYEQAVGKEYRDRILLANGLTIPHASKLGLLPYEILPVLDRSDPDYVDELHQAMIAEGASRLGDPLTPLLCVTTAEEAEACVQRLQKRVPRSRWSTVHNEWEPRE
jgi:hypothetical protein